MADYSHYGGIATDWETYMAKNPQPAVPPGLSPLELQKLTNDGREAASNAITKGLDGVSQQDFSCPTSDNQTIPIRIYKPSSASPEARLPVYIYFHGGGFLFGTLTTEDAACYGIVKALGIVVVNVNYRHTPAWKWPCQAHDAWAALNWAYENMDAIGGDETKVVVGGRSAGANLAAGVVLREKDEVCVVNPRSVSHMADECEARPQSNLWTAPRYSVALSLEFIPIRPNCPWQVII